MPTIGELWRMTSNTMPIKINIDVNATVHVHIHNADSQKLDAIHHDIKELRKVMDANTTRIIGALNDATNAIAARIQALLDRGDLSPEATTALEAEVARLQGLAADPANPVPAETPAP